MPYSTLSLECDFHLTQDPTLKIFLSNTLLSIEKVITSCIPMDEGHHDAYFSIFSLMSLVLSSLWK